MSEVFPDGRLKVSTVKDLISFIYVGASPVLYVGASPVNLNFRPYRRFSADFGYTASEPVGGQGNAGERPEHHTGGRDGRTS